jgi:asparagine synthase (glutamine-hydrolysing)
MRARGVLDGLQVLRRESAGWRDEFAAAETMANTPERTRLQIAQATDIADWLPNDLLTKLDRCLMAHGLEGRTPFLDSRISEAAFLLPDNLKIQKRQGKWLLRTWLENVMPKAKPFARKRGFTVPVGEWMNQRGAKLGELVAKSPAIRDICVAGEVQKLYTSEQKRPRLAGWNLLFYALWHRRHIEGLAPEGGVFDTLSA